VVNKRVTLLIDTIEPTPGPTDYRDTQDASNIGDCHYSKTPPDNVMDPPAYKKEVHTNDAAKGNLQKPDVRRMYKRKTTLVEYDMAKLAAIRAMVEAQGSKSGRKNCPQYIVDTSP
jgi:hypothetical protein